MSDWQVRLNQMGTGVFIAVTLFGAITFSDASKAIVVAVDLGLAAIGVFAFLLGYWTAVQRSRTRQMSVAELYFLMGSAIPSGVKRPMNILLLVQTTVALVTAMSRLTTPVAGGGATNGSTLAFGVLVPVLGLGLNGLWAATHGAFPPRALKEPKRDIGDPEIG